MEDHTETAWDWLCRSRRSNRRSRSRKWHDDPVWWRRSYPALSAQAFLGQPHHTSSSTMTASSSVPWKGTGISFVDRVMAMSTMMTGPAAAALSHDASSPILELTGATGTGTGKTAVCTWLVARYVVATSDSNYSTLRHEDLRLDHESPLPPTLNRSDKQAHQGAMGDLDHAPSSSSSAQMKEHASDNHQPTNQTEKESTNKMKPPLRQHYGIGKGTTWVPRVVILDANHGMHIVSLVNAVRVAVLNRVRDTVPLRQAAATAGVSSSNHDVDHANEDDSADLEWHFIESEITKCLGRIHLVYPQNAHDFVPALESLRHSLDQAQEVHSTIPTTNDDPFLLHQDDNHNNHMQSNKKKRKRWQEDEEERVLPPTLLVMDSLSAFQHVDRMQENLPTANTTTSTNANHASVNSTLNTGAAATGRTTTTTTTGGASSGLSGRNELVRQLQRLLARHSTIVVATTTTNTTSHHDNNSSSSSSWNKIVTHRLTLDKVAPHSREEADGYDFVALVPNKPTTLPNNNHNTSSHNMKHSSTPCDVIPFSITSHGIQTQS